jgi:hypothetical protein
MEGKKSKNETHSLRVTQPFNITTIDLLLITTLATPFTDSQSPRIVRDVTHGTWHAAKTAFKNPRPRVGRARAKCHRGAKSVPTPSIFCHIT